MHAALCVPVCLYDTYIQDAHKMPADAYVRNEPTVAMQIIPMTFDSVKTFGRRGRGFGRFLNPVGLAIGTQGENSSPSLHDVYDRLLLPSRMSQW